MALFGLFLALLMIWATGRKLAWILSDGFYNLIGWLKIQWLLPKLRRITGGLGKPDLDAFATGLIMAGYELGDGLDDQDQPTEKDRETADRIRELVLKGLESRTPNEVIDIMEEWIHTKDPVRIAKAWEATRGSGVW